MEYHGHHSGKDFFIYSVAILLYPGVRAITIRVPRTVGLKSRWPVISSSSQLCCHKSS